MVCCCCVGFWLLRLVGWLVVAIVGRCLVVGVLAVVLVTAVGCVVVVFFVFGLLVLLVGLLVLLEAGWLVELFVLLLLVAGSWLFAAFAGCGMSLGCSWLLLMFLVVAIVGCVALVVVGCWLLYL